MEGPAARLQRLRMLAGKRPEDLAAVCGLTLPAYYDLEEDDQELYMAISLTELSLLSKELRISPEALFSDMGLPGNRIRPGEVARRIRDVIGKRKLTLSEFEDEVGFSIGDSLEDSSRVWDWNVDCLRAVCAALGVDWRRALPLCEEYGSA